jgi:superfamily II DNA or RNA helicase
MSPPKTNNIDVEDVNPVYIPITFVVPLNLVLSKSKAFAGKEFTSNNDYDMRDIIPFILENSKAERTRESSLDRKVSNGTSQESITNISFYEIIELVVKYFSGTKSKKIVKRSLDYTPYHYQDEASTALKDKLEVMDEVNLVSPTRSGKSTIISYLIKKGDFNVTLIITPYPNGYSSFNKMINKHKDFVGFQIVSYKNGMFEAFNEDTQKRVYFVSWAALKNNASSAINIIKNINPELIVLDEFHRESDSINSVDVMKIIRSANTKILNVSATPYDEMMKGLIDDNNSYIITREAIKKYRAEKKMNDFRQMIFTMEFVDVFKSYLQDEWTEDEMPTFAKMFRKIKENGFDVSSFKDEDLTKEEVSTWKFKYESALINTIIHFLSLERLGTSKNVGLAGNQSLLDEYNRKNNSNAKMEDIFKNILLLVPDTASAFMLHNLFQTNDRLIKLGIVTKCSVSNGLETDYVDADNNKLKFLPYEEESRETKIDAWMKHHNEGGFRTMIITSMSHTTAETLSYLSCVVIMREMSSHELFMQTMGRPNNTGSEKIRYTGLVVPKGVFLEKIAKAYLVHTELYPNEEVNLSNIIMNWFDCADSMFHLSGDKWSVYTEDNLMEDVSVERIRLSNDLQKDINVSEDISDLNELKNLFIEFGRKNPEISLESTFSMNDNLGSNGKKDSPNKTDSPKSKSVKTFNDKELAVLGYKAFVEDIKQVVNYAINTKKVESVLHYSDISKLDSAMKYSYIADETSIEYFKQSVDYFFSNISDSNKSVWNRYLHSIQFEK